MFKVIVWIVFGSSITSVLFTPEVVAAVLGTVNTVLIIAHAHHVRRVVEPKVDHLTAQVECVAPKVDEVVAGVATVVNEVTPGWDGEDRRHGDDD